MLTSHIEASRIGKVNNYFIPSDMDNSEEIKGSLKGLTGNDTIQNEK